MKKILSIAIVVLLCVLMMSQTMVSFASETSQNEASFKIGNDKTANVSAISKTDAPEKDIELMDYVKGEAFVVLKNDAPGAMMSKSKAADIYGKGITIKNSADLKGKTSEDEIKAVCLKSGTKSTEELIAEAEKNPAVEYAVPNYRFKKSALTQDTYGNYQWALENTGQNAGTVGIDTNADALWSQAASSSKEQVVAIIDTGIDATHEDIQPVLWKNTTSTLKGTYGYDFANNDTTPQDDDGHGTHCAGIIAASANNSIGISGINTTKTKIMALKVDDKDGYYGWDAIFNSFDYISKAIDAGVNVVAVNCSFGGFGKGQEALNYKKMYEKAFNNIGAKGAITCIASGNDNINLNTLYTNYGYYALPAMCSSKYKITVGASTEDDYCTMFSNWGDKYVDMMAPGQHILSTVSYNHFNPTIYSASQRSQLCSGFQDFSGNIDQTAFGWNAHAYTYNSHSSSLYRITDDTFGLTPNCLGIGESDNDYGYGYNYAIEFPYQISNTSDSYYVSLKAKFLKDVNVTFGDFDASYAEQNYFSSYADDSDDSLIDGDGWTWHNLQFKLTPKSSWSKDRKFVMFFKNVYGLVLFDDVAVSKQGVSESSFGKYDFYDGTSMATPYVAGAIALVHNYNNKYGIDDVLNIIKTKGRVVKTETDYVYNGYSLSLNKVGGYAPAGTKISLKAAKSKITIGSSTTVTASVTNPVGSTKFKSSNTSIATVSSAGKVTAKKAGTVTITATNNGKAASVKITVTKKTNTMTAKGKTITVKKGYKTKSFAKAKAFTVSKAVGKVSFKKASGNSKITVTSAGKVTVKKGLKKGTYKVKVKVTAKGSATYTAVTKTVTVTVKVK